MFNSVREAVDATGASASFVVVPPKFAADAIIEAAEGGITFIVCITEGIPARDEAVTYNRLVEEFPGVRLLGPNCPGIISPGKCNIGITSGDIALAGGPVGIVSRSGTLTYQTKAVMMIGEIGGSEEERAAEWIKLNMTKPVVAYVAGVTAPPGRKMGHAGAIISGSKGTAQAKMEALRDAGVHVCANPTEAGAKMVDIVRAM